MMPWDLASIALVYVLNYLVYSTIVMVAACWLVRSCIVQAALTKVRIWKLAFVLPVLLPAAAMVVPAPWLPVVWLQATLVDDPNPVSSGQPERIDGGVPANYAGGREPISVPADGSAEIASLGKGRELSSNTGERSSSWRAWLRLGSSLLVVTWGLGVLIGLARLAIDLFELRQLIRASDSLHSNPLLAEVDTIAGRMGLRRRVRLLESPRVTIPFTAGWRSPCIVMPAEWGERLSSECREAVIAHEIAHILRLDVVWNLSSQILCRVFWLQPLNVVVRRRLRRDMEFVADQAAASSIVNPTSLARSLVQLAEHLESQSVKRLAVPSAGVGMSIQTSELKSRVSAVLRHQGLGSGADRALRFGSFACAGGMILLVLVPRFGIPASPSPSFPKEDSGMLGPLKKLNLLAGLAAVVMLPAADDAFGQTQNKLPEASTEKDGVPTGLRQFSGMLIGKMVKRDIERGSFSVKVQYVARVWENNKARNPRAVVGHQVTVNGVTGKWLDELLLVRPGETVEFEAQHRGGDELTFPGEWLKKVPAFDQTQHPVPPVGFRGFTGLVTGEIIKKNQTSREIHLRIDQIEKVFEKNRAESATDAVGKTIVLAGFWARMSKPFDGLEKGDRIRAGVLHRVRQSDHFTVIEVAEKIGKGQGTTNKPPQVSATSGGFPEGMRGFRGILRGKLLSKDVEKGTLVFQAERATRTWKANRAADVTSCRGRKIQVNGITGKWIDVLITLKVGDEIEVEAFHNTGQHLDFVSEWLKKVE